MIAIDLGSNTLRCIEYDCQTREFGAEFEAVVRSAEGLHVSKNISENALKRIINTLHQADEKLNFSQHEIVAYTTEALRRAQNSTYILEQISKRCGVDFKIINGVQEASFTTKAVQNRLNKLGLASDSFTLIDIGGGSTEIIFCNFDEIVSKSFDLGIVTLSESAGTMDAIERNLEKLLIPVKEYIEGYYAKGFKPLNFIQTAGTPTTIAAYLLGMTYETYDASKINGFKLLKSECFRTLDELLKMNEDQRRIYVGVGREELIIAGIMIVLKLYELLGYDNSIVIDDGLREGIALSYCENNDQ
jgi:exopolyphosphatase/guanosine-5'-triphosphate,3'-diphosphate pyrophosphatase